MAAGTRCEDVGRDDQRRSACQQRRGRGGGAGGHQPAGDPAQAPDEHERPEAREPGERTLRVPRPLTLEAYRESAEGRNRKSGNSLVHGRWEGRRARDRGKGTLLPMRVREAPTTL